MCCIYVYIQMNWTEIAQNCPEFRIIATRRCGSVVVTNTHTVENQLFSIVLSREYVWKKTCDPNRIWKLWNVSIKCMHLPATLPHTLLNPTGYTILHLVYTYSINPRCLSHSHIWWWTHHIVCVHSYWYADHTCLKYTILFVFSIYMYLKYEKYIVLCRLYVCKFVFEPFDFRLYRDFNLYVVFENYVYTFDFYAHMYIFFCMIFHLFCIATSHKREHTTFCLFIFRIIWMLCADFLFIIHFLDDSLNDFCLWCTFFWLLHSKLWLLYCILLKMAFIFLNVMFVFLEDNR